MSYPANLNIEIYQGGTFNLTLSWTVGGVPVDLSGYTAEMKVKNGGATAIELSTANGRITLSGNSITLTIAATDTGTLTPSICQYDLLLTNGSTVTPLVAGLAAIRQGVSFD